MNDIINPRQAGILTSISIMGTKLLVLPSLLFFQAGNQAIFLLIFMFSIEFLIMYFILKLKQKFYPLGFAEILSLALGKILTKIIYCFFWVFLFLKFMYIFFESYNFLKEMVFEDAELLLFIVCVLPVVSSLVFMGLKTFGRTAQFYFWFIIVGLVICMFVSYLVDASIFPVIDFSFSFIPKSFNVIFWFGDFIFLLLFFDKITPQKNYGNIVLRYVLITMIIVTVFYFIYYSLFNYTSFLHYFALSDIVQFNVFLGDVWKLDIVALLTMMFLLYFNLALLMYSCCECLNKIFVPMKKYYSIIIVNFFVLAYVYLAVLNLQFLIEGAFNYFKYLVLICYAVVPIIFLIIFLRNRKKFRGKYAKVFKKINL